MLKQIDGTRVPFQFLRNLWASRVYLNKPAPLKIESPSDGTEQYDVIIPAFADDSIERHRPFRQNYALADFDYWTRMPLWTIDEAIALIKGRCPDIVKWQALRAFVAKSEFAYEFHRLRQLARGSWKAGILTNPIAPQQFLMWADNLGLDTPSALKKALQAMEQQAVLCLTSQKSTDRGVSNISAPTFVTNSLEQQSPKLIEPLVDSFEKQVFGAKERDSLIKLFYGLALRHYDYDPKDQRGKAPTLIQNDLDLLGIQLHKDTIRKFLRQGATLYASSIDPYHADFHNMTNST